MIENMLSELLKNYVIVFLEEYHSFLSNSQIEILKNIDYRKIISFTNTNVPFGMVDYDKIYLSNVSNTLIDNIKLMDEYNTKRYFLNNKNLSSYLKYICENGYNLLEYYSDVLMYFVFKLVIKDNSGFTNGLINQEIKFLSIKYSIRCANLYAKEEKVISKITPIFKANTIRSILFMDKVSRFKYLNDNYGLRYAEFIENISDMIDKEFKSLDKDVSSYDGFLDYVSIYDKLSYIDAYDCILDFKAQNSLTN